MPGRLVGIGGTANVSVSVTNFYGHQLIKMNRFGVGALTLCPAC